MPLMRMVSGPNGSRSSVTSRSRRRPTDGCTKMLPRTDGKGRAGANTNGLLSSEAPKSFQATTVMV